MGYQSGKPAAKVINANERQSAGGSCVRPHFFTAGLPGSKGYLEFYREKICCFLTWPRLSAYACVKWFLSSEKEPQPPKSPFRET